MKKMYFCFECKKSIPSLDQVYLVEDGQLLTYCSELCVKDFFSPMKEYFLKEHAENQQEMGLLEESNLPNTNDIDALQKILRESTKVFEMENEFGFKITSFLSEMEFSGQTVYSVLICLMYDEKPSLVLFQTYSHSKELLQKMVKGEELSEEQISDKKEQTGASDDVELDKDTLQRMEQKKSKILADLLAVRAETDVPFEKFHLYDQYLSQTLEQPDEIFQWNDNSEPIYSYIRSFNVEGTSFYYLVLCIHHFFDEDQEEEVLLPIIGFPSLDAKIYKIYSKGEQILGNLRS